MKLFKNLQYFIFALFLHVELLAVFFFGFYALYFLNLLIVMYILNLKFRNFSHVVFFLLVTAVLLIINLKIYEDALFELYLWLNLLDEVPYANSEVLYCLTIVHILLFINLKKFDSFWAIIDEKLSRK